MGISAHGLTVSSLPGHWFHSLPTLRSSLPNIPLASLWSNWETLESTPQAFRFPNQAMQEIARSPEEMETLGREMARDLNSTTVIALVGGLGAGKTHWTKGFVAGMGSTAEVTSPTFGLVHEYSGGRYPVFHLDFYRLNSAAELLALGWDELLDQDACIIVEWADNFPELLPTGTIWLNFDVEPDGNRTVQKADLPLK